MLIQKVELSNIKCFANAKVDFTYGRTDGTPHRWVVIYGDNGLGKSTLLKSLGMSLVGEPAMNSLLPNAEGWVRGKSRYGTIRVTAQKGPGDVSIGYPRNRAIEVAWHLIGRRSITLDKRPYSATGVVLDEGRSMAEKGDSKLLRKQIANDDHNRGWMICGYGPHRRLTGNASDIADAVPPDSRAARLVTLFHEKAALSSAERWLKDLHHAASSHKSEAVERLEAVQSMLAQGLLPAGVQLESITSDGVFFNTPFSSHIPISDLSDGYRTVLAMALDLLRHVSNCFELSQVWKRDGDTVSVTAEGVVLIDEIDSHLHPKWQRTIGRWLHSRFPNVQFIVATHSPLIPTRVSDSEGMVIRLTKKRSGKSEYIEPVPDLGRIGLTADQNLTGPNFGLDSTRDLLVDELLADIRTLRSKVRKKQAGSQEREKLKQLELQFERMAPAGSTFEATLHWESARKKIENAEAEASKGGAGSAQ